MDLAELNELIQREIPDGRTNLDGSYANLDKVAAYCEANYLQSNDKQAALDETRRFTVQSLASVAYQVNTLASNLLRMLQLQADNIEAMESAIATISQQVDIHKEKVARREIGLLTTNKLTQRQHKIVTPVHQEKPPRYQRPPIDYSILDDLGHGVRDMRTLVGRTASTVSGGSSGSANSNAWPAGSRTSRNNIENSNDYAPSGHSSMYNPSVSRNSSMNAHVPPGAQAANYSHVSVGHAMAQNVSQDMNQNASRLSSMTIHEDPLPPPPMSLMDSYREQHSPPLPPPPQVEMPQAMYSRNSLPDWVPSNYLDKVIAVYDYVAEKEDELSFNENCVIYVLRKNEDGWFEGVFQGVTGLFPGNYVESCV